MENTSDCSQWFYSSLYYDGVLLFSPLRRCVKVESRWRRREGGGTKLGIMDCFVLFRGDTIITRNKINSEQTKTKLNLSATFSIGYLPEGSIKTRHFWDISRWLIMCNFRLNKWKGSYPFHLKMSDIWEQSHFSTLREHNITLFLFLLETICQNFLEME